MADIELLEGEEWRPVVGYEGLYEVSNMGRVRSLDRVMYDSWGRRRPYKGKILKLLFAHKNADSFTGTDYRTVNLGLNNTKFVHRLVAEAFFGPCPKGQLVMHLNGRRDDNRVENLRYGTQQENILSTYSYGGLAPACKVTPRQVREIRKRINNGELCTELAREFGMSSTSVYAIRDRKSYAWLKEDDNFAT